MFTASTCSLLPIAVQKYGRGKGLELFFRSYPPLMEGKQTGLGLKKQPTWLDIVDKLELLVLIHPWEEQALERQLELMQVGCWAPTMNNNIPA